MVKHTASGLPVLEMKLAEGGRGSVFMLQMDMLAYLSHSKIIRCFMLFLKQSAQKKRNRKEFSGITSPGSTIGEQLKGEKLLHG